MAPTRSDDTETGFGSPSTGEPYRSMSQSASFGFVTAPTISLPVGGGAIRGGGEKFTANPATGTGTLSIPLPVSPARSGFSPTLELRYDSGTGNGPFGLGWQLGLPSVTRKTAKGMPAYRDAPAQQAGRLPVNPVVSGPDDANFGLGAAEDTFLLSGAEDLVPMLAERDGRWVPVVRRRTTAGRTYSVREYLPRIEGLFARIERWTDVGTGDAHWRSISKDNVTTLYGPDANSRITDPRDPSRVFSWLVSESHDDVGNVIRYEYKAEDSAGVELGASHERNRDSDTRSVQRYVKRVRYGNRVSRLVAEDLRAAEWLFEVVFDYGEHDPDMPTPREVRPWPSRLDPFSTCRAGFEVRTYRLCRRVLMFHNFPDEPGVGADCLVRATELTYRGDPDRGEPVISFVESVRQHGYRRRGDGGHVVRSLPPLDLTYSEPVIDKRVQTLDLDSLANLPAGLDGNAYRFVDLDGEGLSGVLTEQADTWFYVPNHGDGRFGPLRAVHRPALAALNGGRQQLLDLSGDGHLDLVDLDGMVPGFTERTADRDWALFRPFQARPDVDWKDPNLRFVDLNGDGLADVLITCEQEFTWHPSLGHAGYGAGSRTFVPDDEERGPRLVFADRTQSIHLADMSGDGLADLVRVRNGEICYWPNLGYGRFGAKVAMDDAPWLDDADQFDPMRIRLADVDGSGTADLIYLHPRGARMYANRSGNSWTGFHELAVAFPRIDDAVAVNALDLLGKGTVCLVWSSPLPGDSGRQVRFLDLMSAGKPHLLVSARNNLGAETHVQYVPSTRFYVADQAAGRPWVTRLPFPVQVVERVETVDLISRNRFTTRYAYHHGYFDGVEREFRGFGMVEQFDTELFAVLSSGDTLPDTTNVDQATHVPPVLTKTWFHTGAFLDGQRISRQFVHEYHHDGLSVPDSVLPDAVRGPGRPPLPWRLTADEARQAVRALKGMTLRQEVYALDGSPAERLPYLVTEHNYTVDLLQPAVQPDPDGEGMRHAVFLCTPRETLTVHHERQSDPRIGHDLVLDVDDFGDVLRAATVSYGRGQTDPGPMLTDEDHLRQRRLRIVVTENDHANAVDLPDDHRTPPPSATRVFEVTGVVPGGRLFGFAELRTALDEIEIELPYQDWEVQPARPSRRLVDHTRSLFRRDDLTGPLPLGVVEPLALPYETYRQALTPELVTVLYGDRVDAAILTDAGYVLIDGVWWVPSGRILYSPQDAGELDFARHHFFLPHRFRDPFGATTTITYDRYDLLAVNTRDAVGNMVTAGDRDAADRIIGNGNDYRVLRPRLVTDANRNRAEAAFDALGRVSGTAVMGKAEEHLGDSLSGFEPDLDQAATDRYLADPLLDPGAVLAQASTRVIYDDLAFWLSRSDDRPLPCVVAALARETHVSALGPGERTRVRHHLSYSDGFGRQVQQKAQAEPGPLTDDGPEVAPRWVGSGWTIFNNKGKPVRTFEPFFTATHRFEFARMVGVSAVLFYDPLVRVVAALRPNGTYNKTVFDPWRRQTWDLNDTVLIDPRRDPDVGGYLRRYLDNIGDPVTWYAARIDGQLGPAEQRAAEQTAVHANTPTRVYFDTLGRTFLTVAHNRFLRDGAPVDETESKRTLLDIENNERAVSDAEQRIVMRYDYDLLSNRVSRVGMDIGGGPVLIDVVGKHRYSWNSRGFRFRTEYDPLRRPVRSHVLGPGLAGELLFRRIDYGENQPDAAARNLRGQVHQQFDEAGVNTNLAYDFKGNPLTSNRRLALAYREVIDWSAPVELEDRTYAAHTAYDALNRPTSMTTPDGSVVQPAYNEASLLERLDGRIRDAAETTTFLANADYNAHGQRTMVELGNGARTDYVYDPLTFRLTRLRTRRDHERLQDLTHTYDPIGNITSVRDDAQQTVFFRNRVVAPNARYVFDAVYRLVEATGREHIGQTGPMPSDSTDAPRIGLGQPGDGAAMARYVERYVYDVVGNILRMSHRTADPHSPDWTRNFTYAERSLLEPGRFGNRLTATTAGDEVTTPQSFGYDEQGNTTAMPELPVLRWDPQDRLQATARQAVSDGMPETTYYVYDATGQRVRKVTEQGGTPRRRAERVYLGAFEIYREYDANGQVSLERETLHVLDGDKRVALAETRTRGEDDGPERLIRYQLANHLQSAVLELDDTARVISYEEYSPYGSTSYQAVRSRTETPKRYRYTGKERDTETGLYYHGARYYAPWLGRWTSCDPAEFAGGLVLYAYAYENPIVFRDRTGRQPDPMAEWMDDMQQQAGPDRMELEWSLMWQSMKGGHLEFDENGRAITMPSGGGVGGMLGGVIRALTFRLVPIENDPTPSSLEGMEVGAGLVPIADPAARLVAGTTVTGQEASRGWAAAQLALDVAPFALGRYAGSVSRSAAVAAEEGDASVSLAFRPGAPFGQNPGPIGHNVVGVNVGGGSPTVWADLVITGDIERTSGIVTGGKGAVRGSRAPGADYLIATVPVTPEQANAARTLIEAQRGPAGAYRLFCTDCTTFASGALDAAGVSTPKFSTPALNYASVLLQSPSAIRTLESAATAAAVGSAVLRGTYLEQLRQQSIASEHTGAPTVLEQALQRSILSEH